MHHLTRRHTAAALFAPAPAHADVTTLHEAAKKEGEVTWYTSQMTGEAAEAMGKRFVRRYPGVTVDAICTTGQVAYSRLTQELKHNTPHCDVYSSTDIAHFEYGRLSPTLAFAFVTRGRQLKRRDEAAYRRVKRTIP